MKINERQLNKTVQDWMRSRLESKGLAHLSINATTDTLRKEARKRGAQFDLVISGDKRADVMQACNALDGYGYTHGPRTFMDMPVAMPSVKNSAAAVARLRVYRYQWTSQTGGRKYISQR